MVTVPCSGSLSVLPEAGDSGRVDEEAAAGTEVCILCIGFALHSRHLCLYEN